MRARLAVCLLFSLLVSGACGGRLVQSGSDDGSGASSNAGSFSDGATSSSGGASSRGGRSGVGGTVASGGRLGIAGTSSTSGAVPGGGTTSAGGGCVCPAKPCPPGYIAVPNADGCCSHCESACDAALCPAIACGSGTHLEQLAGQCCPTCVQDSCEAQRADYQAFRRQLVEKYSTVGCMTSNDCAVYYERNQCDMGCGIAIPVAALNNLDGNLERYAQSSCSPNCMFEVHPCTPPPAALCVRGLCE